MADDKKRRRPKATLGKEKTLLGTLFALVLGHGVWSKVSPPAADRAEPKYVKIDNTNPNNPEAIFKLDEDDPRYAQYIGGMVEENDKAPEAPAEVISDIEPLDVIAKTTFPKSNTPSPNNASEALEAYAQNGVADKEIKTDETKSLLFNEMRHYIWKGVPIHHGVYKDEQGRERFTELGFTKSHLKMMGLMVKDKASGETIWSKQAKLHEVLGISYENYAKNWQIYEDDARNAFIDEAQYTIESLNKLHLQKIWNNVVQAQGADHFLDAEDYVVNGKKYTMDGMTILAMGRFHGVRDTKKFLKSLDRNNPILKEGMAETIERFNGMSHDLDLSQLSIRTFIGEGGAKVRKLDYRKAYSLPEINEHDYMIMLEILAYRESRYKLKAVSPSGRHIGQYQLEEKVLMSRDIEVMEKGEKVKKHIKGYLEKYNDAHNTKYTKADFDKSASLQMGIIRDFHEKKSKNIAYKGLTDYLPYVASRNEVELEYLKSSKEIAKNVVKMPEELKGATQVKAGEGKTEFGFQVGGVYKLRGGRLAKVINVRTHSIQNDALGFIIMAHLTGAGGTNIGHNNQISFNQQAPKDGNGIENAQYLFLKDFAARTRTLQDAIDNKEFEVPLVNGNLKEEFKTSKVIEPMQKRIDEMKAIKGRPIFDEKKYKEKFFESPKKSHSSVELETSQAPAGSWAAGLENKKNPELGLS